MPAKPKRWARAIAGSAAAAALGLGLVPATAAADHPVQSAPTVEGEIPATLEASALGPEHASEHRNGPQGEPTTRAAADEGPSISAPNTATGGTPEEVGRWLSGPEGVIDLPNYAIHAVLLPTGKVLFWGYPPAEEEENRPNGGEAALWDPTLGTGPASLQEVDPPLLDPDGPAGPQKPVKAPLYCSGQTLLPNGDMLATGGNLVWPEQYDDDAYGDFSGLNTVYVFDPFAERWVRQDDMEGGRWYPSQVLLGDGRTPIIGGYTEAPSPPGTTATDTQVAEVYTPSVNNGGRGTIETVADDPDFATALYPHLFTLPSDRVLLAGPAAGDSARLSFERGDTAGRIDIASPPDKRNRIGGTAVLEPKGFRGSWKATQFGGYDDRRPINPGADPDEYEYRALGSSVRTDGKKLKTAMAGPTALARSYANTVILPDRSLLTVGGGGGRDPEIGNYFTGGDLDLKRVELRDPETGVWRFGPNQREYRAYHSTALLLPDGRVWSAGDDYHAVERRQLPGAEGFKAATRDTAEIYLPPYLFAPGRRPKIKKAPETIPYGDRFGVRLRGGKGGKSAVLIAPGATTHGADMHQRMVTLRKTARVRGKGINLKLTPEPGVAPPGYYMLFVLNGHGKPSIAKWIKIDARADGAPTLKRKKRGKGGGNRKGKGKRGGSRGG